MIKVTMVGRTGLRGAAKRAAVKADATRYLRNIASAESQGFRLGM